MHAIVMLMLAVQVGVLLAASYAIVMRRPTPARPRPIWTSLALSLIMIAAVSWQIADKHDADVGSRLLMYGSPLVMGMGIAMALMGVRERRFGAAA